MILVQSQTRLWTAEFAGSLAVGSFIRNQGLDNCMYKTILFSGLLLAVAFGGPISMFRFSDFWHDLGKGTLSGKMTTKADETPGTTEALKLAANTSDGSLSTVQSPTLSLEGTPTPVLAEVLRFDISPAWVLHRWPRVSTDLAYLQMQGYRVPLVTGTSERDVAGSLTYYFNPAQQVQQITLRGAIGDPRTLISFLTSRYGFVRRPNNDPSRLVFETVDSQGKTIGTMIVQSAPVVRADQPYQRYKVDLIMDRP
jgi:hypothetical protein